MVGCDPYDMKVINKTRKGTVNGLVTCSFFSYVFWPLASSNSVFRCLMNMRFVVYDAVLVI